MKKKSIINTSREPEKQGHRTPPEFLEAIQRRFGRIAFDLAATPGHEVLGVPFFSPSNDSLAQRWDALVVPHGDVVYLNPPFGHIVPWVRKLAAECQHLQRWTTCLVPASMGSLWWRDHVRGKCVELGVTRMTFVGSTISFPKDLALLCYGYGVSGVGFWDWRTSVPDLVPPPRSRKKK